MHRLKKSHVVLLCLLFLSGMLADQGVAQDKAKMKGQSRSRVAASSSAQGPSEQILDINNMTTWVVKDGFFDWIDPTTGFGWNGTFPKGTTGAVFAQGTVWGGQIVEPGQEPDVRVNGYTYADGMDAGKILPIEGGKTTGPDNPDNYHVWRVRRNWRTMDYNASASAYYGVSLNAVTDAQRTQLRAWYEDDWNNWPADLGAPFQDNNNNGIYEPATDANGDGIYQPEEGDIPGYPGADQTLWLVANDLSSSTQSYGSPPIGIEYQLTLWGYDFPSTSPLGNITFEQARMIYRGTPTTPAGTRIDSMFVVKWADVDIGDAGDDFAGSDTTLLLGYAYNASQIDATYANFGLPPTAVGWDFLQGPITAEGDTLGMTSFVYFAAGSTISDPDLQEEAGTLQWYNLMRGVQPRPQYPAAVPFVNPLTNEPAVFTLTGDPVTAQGWIDGAELPPGDRRLVLTTGPFSLALGDTVDVVVGQVGGLGSSNLSSVTVMKYHDQFAQYAYDNDFLLPSPPPMPSVNVAESNGQIVLNWGNNLAEVALTENSNSRGFEFEGYNVYQLPASNSPLSDGVKLATYDLNNNVTVIQDQVVDEKTGFIIERPVQIGPDEGIQRFYQTERDAVRGRPLANGVEYYYAVTAYSYLPTADETVPFRTLESAPVLLTVIPQTASPGVAGVSDYGTVLPAQKTAGAGDAIVSAVVVDPEQVVDASYEITIDTTGGQSWNLLKGGQPVLTDQEFGTPTSRTLVDGLQVNVSNVTFAVPDHILDHYQVGPDGDPVSGALHLWGDATLFGAPVGYYSGVADVDAPSLEDAYPDLEFRFTGNGGMEAPTTSGGQLASYWARAAFGLGAADLAGVESAVIRMPFELWDIENDRQVNFAVIGRNADGESPWGDGVGEYYRMAGRDYIIPIMTEYNEAEVQASGTSPAAPGVTWLLPFEQGGDSQWKTGDVYRVEFANPVVAGVDTWAFQSSASVSGVDSLLTASVDEINVFPNPYIGFSRLETSRAQKFVTFTHLPEQATIRIFDLAGTIVRVIEHDDPSQFERWDLTNQDNVPVASGVYLVHVETDFGEKVLKVALVQEEQILQRY